MSFISYAQNFEDVMLHRALKDITNGFYIDVGANDPIEDSLTKAFYDIGWSGINIEPQSEFFELLLQQRTRDTNLNVAISNSKKDINFYVSHIRGWSTTNISAIDDTNKDYFATTPQIVKTMSLDEVISLYNVQNIHFLKIDVEGAEKDVLQSFSFSIKPWIIVVEATLPSTNTDNSKEWEYILLSQNYTFAYFDGINKFYISPKHLDLLVHFSYPPNVLDDFLSYPLYRTLQFCQEQINTIASLQETQDTLSRIVEEKSNELQEKSLQLQNYMQLYNMVINSRSWKVTAPLRAMIGFAKKLFTKTTQQSDPVQ